MIWSKLNMIYINFRIKNSNKFSLNFSTIHVLIINHQYIFFICNLILYWHIFYEMNDLCKIIIITKRAKLSSKILLHRFWNFKMIHQHYQLQSNCWWLWLMQQLQQNLDQAILTLSKKSTFIVIKIDTNMSLKIVFNHSILLNHIMLWKIQF